MTDSKMYHEEHRYLQKSFQTVDLADRLEDMIVKSFLDEKDKSFIQSREMFFLSTVDRSGRPTVSYKGGPCGFISILDDRTIAFPSYDGNGMFYSMGNISATAQVGILFIDFETPHRMRMQGAASIDLSDTLIEDHPKADLIVRVKIERTWINCPRYIPKYKKIEDSKYLPKEGSKTPVAEWKKLDAVRDVLSNRDKEAVKSLGETLTMEEYAKKVSEGDG